MKWDKMIAAGRTVSASVELDGTHSLAFIDFATAALRITAIRIFTDA
jgi:hypothetical protein